MTTADDPSDAIPPHVAASIAHDVRNALHTATGSFAIVAAALPSNASARVRMEAARVSRALRHVDDLLADLVDRSALDADALELHLSEEHVKTLVEQTLALVLPRAVEKNILVTQDIVPEDLSLCCDGTRIQRVLGNLLGNALKFTPREGCITIRASKTDSMVRLQVIDSGPGIPVDALPHIFKRHWTRKSGGAGLGLAIVRDLVARHGGRVGAGNRDDGVSGAVFTLDLPAAARAARPDRG